MVENGNKKICVIGAGSSGLAAIKACKEENFEVVCYEKGDYYGGLWHFHPDDSDGIPSVMKSTVINTSKEMSAFSDFPPPEKFANFMHNSKMIEYFKLYAERYDLLKHILYKHEFQSVEMADDYDRTGRLKVTAIDQNKKSTVTNIYDGVMVCTGHHIYPHTPNFEGLKDFKGKVVHTHSLKSSEGFDDKKTLVIGIGNSAVDAAVEISKVSKQLYLSNRRGSWVFSRIGPRGIPYDIFLQKRIFEILRYYDIFRISDSALEFLLNWKFNHAKYSLQPHHRVLSSHPTINDALPNCVLSGTVTIKQNVEKFTEDGVIFENEDNVTKIDAVVMATGYNIRFPFISENILQVRDNMVHLYKFIFPPHLKYPSLAFIALVQPLGAMFPLAEAQSRWYVQLMKGNVKLPTELEMEEEVQARRDKLSRQFVPSPRHTIQVIWIHYMDELCSEFGAKPNMWKMAFTDPKLYLACMFGPCTPYQYRLQGPHAWDKARDAIFSSWNRIEAPLNTRKRS